MWHPTHLIEPEVPWENILAYVEACREYTKQCETGIDSAGRKSVTVQPGLRMHCADRTKTKVPAACLWFFYQFFIKPFLVLRRALGYDTDRKD